YYRHVNEKKRGFAELSGMGPATQALIGELHSPGFLAAIEALTGVRGLIADHELDGGGLHEPAPGCFLNSHTDFLPHTTRPPWLPRPRTCGPRPEDAPVKRPLTRIDDGALPAYSANKRHPPLGDRLVSAILRRL